MLLFIIYLYLINTASSTCVPSQNVVCLYNNDFQEGTYLCDQEGVTYKLAEDIEFKPQEENNFRPVCGSDNDSVYCSDAFTLGFFAAIAITAKDVKIDLNGKTIEASLSFSFNQRFMSIIELGNSPFIDTQGPAEFGHFQNVSNVEICCGTIGRSSHHGIHGNDASNVHIHDLTITNFEVAGIHLNGCEDVIIEDVSIEHSSHEVQFVSTLSQAQNLVPKLALMNQESTVTINGRGDVSIATLKNDLENEINTALTDSSYNGIFRNPANFNDLPDGSFLGGIVVVGGKGHGFAIHEFSGQNPDELPKPYGGPLTLKNVIISNLTHHTQEHVHLEFKIMQETEQSDVEVAAVRGPFGGLIQLSQVTDNGLLGSYKSTSLYDAMYALCLLRDDIGKTCSKRGWQELTPWISGEDEDLETTLGNLGEEVSYSFIGNKDSMSHHLKGVVGLRLEYLSKVTLENIVVEELMNVASESPYHTSFIDEAYRGGDVFGIVLGKVEQVETLGSVQIANLETSNGVSAGLAFNGEVNGVEFTSGYWNVEDIVASGDRADPLMTNFLQCPSTGQTVVSLSWDDVPTSGVRSCPLAQHVVCDDNHISTELCNSSHEYESVGAGYCRNPIGRKKFMNDWNFDSEEECRHLCNNLRGCSGYQYGTVFNPKDCNIYEDASQANGSSYAVNGCMKKVEPSPAYVNYEWLGRGFCRNADGEKELLLVIQANSEYECKIECDNFTSCAGFQFGRTFSISECALYGSAETRKRASGFGGCWKKTN